MSKFNIALENPLYSHFVVGERSLKRLDVWVEFAVPHVSADRAREWADEVKTIYKTDMRGLEVVTREEYIERLMVA